MNEVASSYKTQPSCVINCQRMRFTPRMFMVKSSIGPIYGRWKKQKKKACRTIQIKNLQLRKSQTTGNQNIKMKYQNGFPSSYSPFTTDLCYWSSPETRYCKILATKSSSESPKVFPMSLTEERCFTKMDSLFQIPTIRPALHPSYQCLFQLLNPLVNIIAKVL